MWGYAIRGEGHWLKIEEPPRALREVERNPEKLANADGRCWKDTLGRKRSFKTHRPPFPTRRGLVTAWQETKKLLHDESGRTMPGPEDLKGKNIQKLPGLVKRPKNKQKGSLEESCESLVGTADGREERRRRS